MKLGEEVPQIFFKLTPEVNNVTIDFSLSTEGHEEKSESKHNAGGFWMKSSIQYFSINKNLFTDIWQEGTNS